MKRRNFLKGAIGVISLPITIPVTKGKKKEDHDKIVGHIGNERFHKGQAVYYQYENCKRYVTAKYKRNAFAGVVRWDSYLRAHRIGITIQGKTPISMQYE